MKAIIAILTAVALVLAFAPVASAGDPAIICKSDSTGKCAGRKYCCYPSGMSHLLLPHGCQRLQLRHARQIV